MNQYYYRNLKDNSKIIRVYENEAPDWNEWEQISDREAQQSERIAELEAALTNIINNVDMGDFIITVAGTHEEPEHPANLDFARKLVKGIRS